MKNKGPVSQFIKHHYRHFNAAALVDAAEAYEKQINNGGKMLVSLAGAMSTAEIGISLAEMIRQDKVHIISCTGANLEEDVTNLVAHSKYKRVPNYRDLSPEDELALLQNHYSRVTDTCIPEEEAFRKVERELMKLWKEAEKKNERYLPHEYFYQLLLSGKLKDSYEIDPKNSWMLAAAEKNLPIIVPGWEDSTMGNVFAACCVRNDVKPYTVKCGTEYMMMLCDFYKETTLSGKNNGIGFFQIGGGIAGDFPICVVPLIKHDLFEEVPCWNYFCQISDSTTSFGSYSGAVPNEKITWSKLEVDTPRFIVESDASIVAPLIFAYVLGQ